MKPPAPLPSPDGLGSDVEQPLLQAAREMRQPEPGPALDALILEAAAKRAAEIRQARVEAAASTAPNLPKTPGKSSALERFSRWLLGDGQMRGHLGQAVAASVFIGVAIGLVLKVEQESSLSSPLSESNALIMEPPPPKVAPPLASPGQAREKNLDKAMRAAEENRAKTPGTAPQKPKPMEPASVALPAQEKEGMARKAAMQQKAQDRVAESDAAMDTLSKPPPPPPAAVAFPPPSPSPSLPAAKTPAVAPPASLEISAQQEETKPAYADRNTPATVPATLAPLDRAQTPARSRKADTEATPKMEIHAEIDAEIDAQLKRILDLRRAGKKEEAELLLRQLRARYPEANIDESLRRLEREEN
ncbi:MAG: hypothetical protein FWD77_11595 [Betaproteobacteria bacterium]|nr:hypothetical protein [Betaproteobacteria bacterium]